MDRYQRLAAILVDGLWTLEAIEQVVARVTSPRSKSRKRLGIEVFVKFQRRPARNPLGLFLRKHEQDLCNKVRWDQVEAAYRFDTQTTSMRGNIRASFADRIPVFGSVDELAEWCGQSVGIVDWLSKHRKEHYRLRTTPKRSGAMRIIEAPRLRLKTIQRVIANGLLHCIPSHASVHGFVRNRSAITYVQQHVGMPVLLRMDLQDFFPSINASRVFGLFRVLGYPHSVTQTLTDLCTTTCSDENLESLLKEHLRFLPMREELNRLRSLYCRKHLPQGAPTSPTLANLIAYRMDCRLAGLAKNVGLHYTRYADDLLFSGGREFGRFAKSFSIKVASIALDEGFQVQFRKTRIMRAATQQTAAGIVINRCTNVNRVEYDRLKAILFNAGRFGPSTQNRDSVPDFESHLRGRINWVCQLNSIRGEKLLKMFQSIDWSR